MDDAARVREKIDIVSLISEYIPLKKMGRNFTTNCPFHTEKSPSFVVSPERQIWHCFGCGKGGDVFTFLMEYENLDFIEALRILAKKTGIVLKENYSNLQSSQKDKFYKLNKIAQEFYNYVLLNHSAGKKALQYLLEKRKLNKGLIENFGLGFSPSGGTALSDYLISKKKYKKEDLIAAGLSFQRGNRVIDFFRGRIMFPLTDIRGNVVGFSGRITEQNTDGPKYINTKETLIYHKGRMFFGFDKAKEEIKERGFVIIMEGEFDVISSFKEGIKNSIAIKGTALTEEQATILSRVTEKVMLCLDRDLAGLEATKRSLAVLEKKGILSNVVVIDGGKDPDEILNNDPVSFKKSVDSSVSAYEFLIKEISKRYNKDSADGKRKITNEILPLIFLVENEIVKEHYLKKLSQEIDTSIESLSRQFGKLDKEDSS
ncbi:MAG: DNA primase, partial [Candidatus Levybacteria bacterium]|nr:DNA primase [Candidatus Levybacteria bacterium]